MGFEFEILYKEAKETKVADGWGWCRCLVQNGRGGAIKTGVQQKIKKTWAADPHISKFIQDLEKDPASQEKYT